jgi:hypothetical protein
MKLLVIVAIATLSLSTGSGLVYPLQGDCPTIQATVETKNPDPGQDNGEIIIHAKGGKGQLSYFFFNSGGYPLNSTRETQNFIKNLKKGSYKCSVVDEIGCIKLFKVDLN